MALLLGIGVATATAGVVPEALYHKAAREGSVRVIVQLRVTTTPEGKLQSAAAVSSQRQDIAAMRSAALAELAGTSHRTIREFTTIPFVALEVAPDAMATLEASPNVVGVEEDRLERASLSQSVPLIGADQAWAAGFDGTGVVVAILDTGVDKTHPFLSGKVVEEACYSNSGNCPNGLDSQTGSGAGVPCTYALDGCRHGTHVAGIAAGASASFSGVAKKSQIIAVQVFSRTTGSFCIDQGEDPCAGTSASDQIAGLERVFALRSQFNIAAVNMSLGGGKFTSACDSQQAARKAAIDNLRSVGIATVISSGNEGFTDGLSAPACISTAVSVGSTTKSDAVSSFSNSATFLSLLAPGSSINSSVPGGGFAVFSGTSMAAPHVSGAWAILKQAKPSATVDEILTALTNTGVPITDPKNGLTKPRIRVDQALQAVTTSHSLTITSGPSGTPNPVASGATASLSVSATDSLGHSLSYAWTASCPTLGSNGSFNNAALQTPAWTAPSNTTGSQQSCTMQVTVSDGQGLSHVGSYAQGVATMPGPDLVPSINPVSSTGTPGGTIQLSASVVNQGAVSAGAFRLGSYFSTNTTITTFDTFFAFCTFSGLAVGQSGSCSGSATIPTSLSPGVYFVGVIADDLGAVAESNEANNTAFAGPITLTQAGSSSSRLTNISTRGRVETGDNVMIGGFIIGGSTPKTVLVQAIGPAMTAAGVPGVVADPVLQLFSGSTAIAQNDDWQVTQPLCQQSGHTCGTPAAITAAGLAPTNPLESAILITLAPGAYTAIVSGFAGTTGVGMVAVFEVDSAATTRLTNISTRGRVETGDNVMIGGFIIGGSTSKTVLVQAIGPAMTAAGVPGVVADPVLQLFSGSTAIAENDDWQNALPLCQQSGYTCGTPAAIAATGLAPTNPLESAILITLAPGPYTAIVSGFGGTTGVGMVAVFEVP